MSQAWAAGAGAAQPVPHFILYSRSYCHLCEDMLDALRSCMARAGRAYTVDVLDVDAAPALLARFDELVPVLYTGGPGGVELCHYFLDEAAVLGHLAAREASPSAVAASAAR